METKETPDKDASGPNCSCSPFFQSIFREAVAKGTGGERQDRVEKRTQYY